MSAFVTKLDVFGDPAPQGSKKHVGRGVLIESSKRVKPWRKAVTDACAHLDDSDRHRGPVQVDLLFYFARPKSHYGTGRSSEKLRATAPTFPVSRRHGDGDKLARSTLDGLVDGGAIEDDALVVDLRSRKRYTTHSATQGAVITIRKALA